MNNKKVETIDQPSYFKGQMDALEEIMSELKDFERIFKFRNSEILRQLAEASSDSDSHYSSKSDNSAPRMCNLMPTTLQKRQPPKVEGTPLMFLRNIKDVKRIVQRISDQHNIPSHDRGCFKPQLNKYKRMWYDDIQKNMLEIYKVYKQN